MAYIGSFVPAESAVIGPIDRILHVLVPLTILPPDVQRLWSK